MYKKILESLDDIICVTDQENNIIYSNHSTDNIENLVKGKQSNNDKIYSLKLNEIMHEGKKYKLYHYKEDRELCETINNYQIDSTTGLPNRNSVDSYLMKVSDLDKACVIALLDIDFFKKVNDNFGHVYGDAILSEFASLLKLELNELDFVGRYGGEEFIIILNSKAVQNSLVDLDLLRQKIENHFKTITGGITTSIGVACYQKGDSIMKVVEDADKALYYVKENGRNNVGFWNNNDSIRLFQPFDSKVRK